MRKDCHRRKRTRLWKWSSETNEASQTFPDLKLWVELINLVISIYYFIFRDFLLPVLIFLYLFYYSSHCKVKEAQY